MQTWIGFPVTGENASHGPHFPIIRLACFMIFAAAEGVSFTFAGILRAGIAGLDKPGPSLDYAILLRPSITHNRVFVVLRAVGTALEVLAAKNYLRGVVAECQLEVAVHHRLDFLDRFNA